MAENWFLYKNIKNVLYFVFIKTTFFWQDSFKIFVFYIILLDFIILLFIILLVFLLIFIILLVFLAISLYNDVEICFFLYRPFSHYSGL